jgi:eukaryotic-like serine/threonine-protein kinase
MEALAVSKLQHPNTIRIFDFGQTEDGQLFIAMEFLRGRSLEHELREKKSVAVNRVLHVISQVCGSLAEAHEKSIVHRDLKPDNIFLCQVGKDDDFAKVLDFGVAKLKAEDKKQGTLTEAGMVFGNAPLHVPRAVPLRFHRSAQ